MSAEIYLLCAMCVSLTLDMFGWMLRKPTV